MPFLRRLRNFFAGRSARPPRPGEPDVDLTDRRSVGRVRTGSRYRMEQRDTFEGGRKIGDEIRTGKEYNVKVKNRFNADYGPDQRGTVRRVREREH